MTLVTIAFSFTLISHPEEQEILQSANRLRTNLRQPKVSILCFQLRKFEGKVFLCPEVLLLPFLRLGHLHQAVHPLP